MKAVPPQIVRVPINALASMEAYRAFYRSGAFSALDDIRRIEAYLYETVIIQADGRLVRRMSAQVEEAIYADLLADSPRDYVRVQSPSLAIYASAMLNLSERDPVQRQLNLDLENKYMSPFREKSIALVKRDLANAEVIQVPGSHGDFIFVSRDTVTNAICQFLG
jgi:hypothetical protein